MSDGQILHLFGGKGGVGKTTLSAAFALNLIEEHGKEKILLVTSDGGEALSDLLKKKLSPKPAKLVAGKGQGGLSVAEYDAKAAREPFLKKYQPALEAAVGKGLHLSQDDLLQIFKQSTVGLDELAHLFSLLDALESGTFDRIVVDTAPTARTLRLIDAAAALKRTIALARHHEKGQAAEKAAVAKGPKAKDAKDAAPAPAAPGSLDEVVQKCDRLIALLKDPARCSFHLVTLAEPVPEAQTRMYFTQLRERQIPVSEIIVNQAEDHEGCPACQGRRGLQAPHVRKFQTLDPKGVPVNLLQKREIAPRGLDDLKKLAKAWATGKETKALEFSAAEGPPALVRAPSMPPIAAPPIQPTRLIFFVGQGGVGKSSCAAAAAVTLTEKEGPVLLISTDPAHSLSDVLQSRLTDTETQVKGTKGLYARELDVPGWFNALKKRIKEKAEKAFEPKADAIHDREVLRNLLDAAPPSIEEFAGLSALTDALIQERFKRIVVDPSPALDVVRLLELPDIARTWLTAVHTVLSKYRAKGLADLADEVGGLIKHVKRFEDALASPNEARFVVVTRGEELASVRTERLVTYLKEKKLNVERVLVNRVLPKSTCAKCENRRKNELQEAKQMEKDIGVQVTVAPALGRHPAGLRELKAFRTAWYALSEKAKTKAA